MKSQADKRREAFNQTRDRAKEISGEALRSIDQVLREEEQLLAGLQWATKEGFMSDDEADDCFAAYVDTRYGTTFQGGDSLAAPLTNVVDFPGQRPDPPPDAA